MTTDPQGKDPLDGFFDAARQADAKAVARGAPDHLMARVLADSERLQRAALRPPVTAGLRQSTFRLQLRAAFAQVFGGPVALAGYASVGAVGVFLGYAQPFDLIDPLLSATTDLFPEADGFFLDLIADAQEL